MPEALHPLVRRRRILVEAFDQVAQVLDFFTQAGWETRGLEEDLRRIHLRLIQTQQEIEQNDLD
jgi:hypothetical protein